MFPSLIPNFHAAHADCHNSIKTSFSPQWVSLRERACPCLLLFSRQTHINPLGDMIYFLSVLHFASEQHTGLRTGFKLHFSPNALLSKSPGRTSTLLGETEQGTRGADWIGEMIEESQYEAFEGLHASSGSVWMGRMRAYYLFGMGGSGKHFDIPRNLCLFNAWHGEKKTQFTWLAEYNCRAFGNKLRSLDGAQESSCTLRLQRFLIDFQSGTTSRKHYATGLGPTKSPGGTCSCRWERPPIKLLLNRVELGGCC